ncbi:M28 family peptidase [Chitinophaga pendula]|uniref:M28 family peptidase n=1 Tax=Chitinophaga TaxID=79328 RepID=UPI000BAF5249|nr:MULTISPECIES: M28 family peptidase [Chitinophaga]ASZ10622.1 peptidase M28 [Chitinophaga sp. MD30]UCJ06402.1 M28 family peptidase [Chitinophaga pendula]
MRKHLVIAGLTLVGFNAYAQQSAALKSSTASKYAAGITAEQLKKQLYIVAGPAMEGRETGTEGQRKAAAYIQSQFVKAGLKPGADGKWEQYFYLTQDTLTTSKILVGDREFAYAKDYYTSLKGSRSAHLTEQEVVYAGYGITADNYDDYNGLDVKGKVVVVREGEPQRAGAYFLSGSNKAGKYGTTDFKHELAAKKGASALLIVNSQVSRMGMMAGDRLRRSGVYVKGDVDMSAFPTVFYITPELGAAITGQATWNAEALKVGGYATKLAIHFDKGAKESQASNVLAYLEGTDKKDEVVFVTAHYDHLGTHDGKIFHGADDDGSGTVSVIELATAFAKAKREGKGPRRSMVFMTVSGEEKGLLGSKFYTEHPIYPLAQTVADLNIDMIGRVDPDHAKDENYIYIIGDNKLSSALRPISEAANDTYTKLALDYKYNDPDDPNRFYYRSDHYMFAQHGIPIIFYFNGTHADYHRPTDTVEKIQYDLMAKRAQLVFYTAWDIVNRDERLPVDRHEQ